jgi:fatty acid desaturase
MLPREAFLRHPQRLFLASGHLAVIVGACWLVRRTQFWPLYFLASLIIGHSLACLAFFAHEVSHGSILKRGAARTAVETMLWALNVIPATLWDEVHNHTHHPYTNTMRDADRRFIAAEKDTGTTLYTILLYPHRQTARWNPLVFLQFPSYILRHVIAFLSGGHWGMLPANPEYTWPQRVRIVCELVLIVGIQYGLYAAVGFSGVKYLFVGPFAVVVASAVVMAYVFTNHFLDPLNETGDAVASTTSVTVPFWLDSVHFHFSYHVEHHLFPSMDSRYYPQVSGLLRQHFPGEYKRLPIGEAWRRLWNHEAWESPPSAKREPAVR